MVVLTPYRQCKVDFFPYIDDFTARIGEDAVDREGVARGTDGFSESQQSEGRLEGVESAPSRALVNALAMMSPYGPRKSRRCWKRRT